MAERIKKIELKIGDKSLGCLEVDKTSSAELEKMKWMAILHSEPKIYSKGVIAAINVGKDYKETFKVKKTFALHGFAENRVYVTIPVTLETLKGLGFISKKK